MPARRTTGRNVALVLAWMAIASCCPAAWGFFEPPTNLSLTTFMDGGAPPGLYYLNYSLLIDGGKAVDKNGNTIPGGAQVNSLASMHQLYYVMDDNSLLGGKLCLDVFVPVVAVTVKGALGSLPLTANTAGLGDIVAGPAIQWDHGTLGGFPLFQRVETLVTMPTGKYDKAYLANPGSNLWTSDTYYSFVWLFAGKWETSDRLWFSYNSQNPDTGVKPGMSTHINYTVSREVVPKLRIGAAGYVYREINDDKIGGVRQPDSRERVASAGPGLFYQGQALLVALTHPIEFWGENRFIGSRTTLQLIYKF